jgi:hypothetical protein
MTFDKAVKDIESARTAFDLPAKYQIVKLLNRKHGKGYANSVSDAILRRSQHE